MNKRRYSKPNQPPEGMTPSQAAAFGFAFGMVFWFVLELIMEAAL